MLQADAGVDKVVLHILFLTVHALCVLYHTHVLAFAREIIELFKLMGKFNKNQGSNNKPNICIRRIPAR